MRFPQFFKTSLCFFLVLASKALGAQDLQVYYDLFTDSVKYLQQGEWVTTPKIRKGDRVVVHFTEYNPYIYQAKTDVLQYQRGVWGGGAGTSAMAGLIPGMSMIMPGMGADADGGSDEDNFSLLDLPIFRLGQNSIKLKDLFGNSRGAEQLLDEARVHLSELGALQQEMENIYNELRELDKVEDAELLANHYLDQLVLNPNIPPSEIKRLVAEYKGILYGENLTGQNIALKDVFRAADRAEARKELVGRLKHLRGDFGDRIADFQPVAIQLINMDMGDETFSRFAADLAGLTQRSTQFQEGLDGFIAAQEQKKNNRGLGLSQQMQLQQRFLELESQRYTYECAFQAERDEVVVEAVFTPWDSLQPGAVKSVRKKFLKLDVLSGLRISAGFGAAFSRFNSPAQNFVAREGVLLAEDGDLFQPNLVSLVHFYAANNKPLNLAGTFGIGLAIGDRQSVSFFLGPSLLIGRGQNIVLTGGILGGQVERLAKGFKPGDAFDPDLGDIPTRQRYELGYFLGLSFNIGR